MLFHNFGDFLLNVKNNTNEENLSESQTFDNLCQTFDWVPKPLTRALYA